MSDDYEKEELEELAKLKILLKTAIQSDFQIVSGPWSFPYAVSHWGCHDIGRFKRKADAERFIKTFPKEKS